MPFKIYKGDEVVTEGESPLEITGLSPNTDVAAGDYQAVRVEDDRESERVDIPAFKTLPIAVTGVTVNPTSLSLDTGATDNITATVTPANATNKSVTWQSDNTDVATVNGSGVVTAVSAGSATITVTTADGAKTATCEVTVTDPVINVTGVALSPKTSNGEAGTEGTRQLTATVEPTNATNKSVSYAITPSATGLSVNNSGLISWSADTPAGEYTTTVTTDDGDYTDTHVLTLTEPEPDPEPEPEPDPGDGEEGE